MAAIPFSVDDLTTVALDGDGVFDKLLKASTLHLKQEFDAQRIRGNDYATVYTALIGAAMQSAVQFALQKPITDQQAAKTALELELLAAQIRTEQANTLTLEGPTLPSDSLIYKQRAILEEQFRKLEQDTLLTTEKVATEKAQTKTTPAIASDSVLGRQINLYKEQAQGFKADRAAKRVAAYSDFHAIQLNISDTYAETFNANVPILDLTTALTALDTASGAAA